MFSGRRTVFKAVLCTGQHDKECLFGKTTSLLGPERPPEVPAPSQPRRTPQRPKAQICWAKGSAVEPLPVQGELLLCGFMLGGGALAAVTILVLGT